MKDSGGNSTHGNAMPAHMGGEKQTVRQHLGGLLQGQPCSRKRSADVTCATSDYEDPVKVWEGVRDATVRAQDIAGNSALQKLTEEQTDILEMRAARDPAERQVGQDAKSAADVLAQHQDIAESPLRIHVRAPASCANLGSGFDCLGLAVNIWNELIIEEAEKQEVIIHGEGEGELPRDDSNLRRCAGQEMHDRESSAKVGERDVAFFAMEGEWLHQAGLAVEVCDENFLLKTACDLEGHADNAAAALFGGLQLALKYVPRDPMTVLATIEKTHYPTPFDIKKAKEAAAAVAAAGGAVSPLPGDEKSPVPSPRPGAKHGGKVMKPKTGDDAWMARGVPIPDNLKCVLFVPDEGMETSKAREVLPKTVSLADAVFNSARTALLVYAMNTAAAAAVVAEAGEGGTPAKAAEAVEDVLYRLLQDAMDDRLHQRFRAKLNPHLEPMMDAAQRAVDCTAPAVPPAVVRRTRAPSSRMEECYPLL